MTIGFAPGQPYLGRLPPHWDIPRLSELTPNVPEGALVTAVRQYCLFSKAMPTGWRHVGQTAFRAFRPEEANPFPMNTGDEVAFTQVSEDELDRIIARDVSGNGGATREALP